MTHLKRYSMPEFWPLPRKARSYVITPMPGPHPKYHSIPLRVVLRDCLKLTETSAETGKVLNAGKVLVDKKVRKEPHFPVGLMDVIEIPELGARYRVSIARNGLALEKIKEDEASSKLCMITGKTTIKGGAHQLHLHDGRNMVSKGPYKVGDSILIEVPGQKILKHYSLKKGEPAFITAGRNRGVSGKIKEIKERKGMLEKSTITIEDHKGRGIETLKGYVMVGSLHEARMEAEDEKPKEGDKRPKAKSEPKKPAKEK